MRTTPLVAMIAALHGAAGVALAAAASHANASPLLGVVSQFLMVHAGAELALAALLRSEPPRMRLITAAALALCAGVTLFSADLAARIYAGGRIFPYAAPIGGGAAILAWLALAVVFGLWLLREKDGRPPTAG